MMRFVAQYCVPVGWIGFYLYHAIRLSKPSSKVKNHALLWILWYCLNIEMKTEFSLGISYTS